MKKTVVVALGGNAIGGKKGNASLSEQFHHTERAMECLVPLLKRRYGVVVTHGNGPQVGSILIRVEEALGKTYSLPLEVCVAESEGEMGYMIEQVLQNVLKRHRLKRAVASVLTQVVVDPHDPGFHHPTKPIGPVFNVNHARLLQKKGHTVIKVVGGYRRVVASPKPVRIDDVNVIHVLLEKGVIVIAAGGGGIPVVQKKGRLEGVEAVIDKDLASAKLATDIHADELIIVTSVPCVYLDYGKKLQRSVKRLSVAEAQLYLMQGQFPEGSMGPKIEAAIQFLKRGGKKVIITSPEHVEKALKGESGTEIVL